MEIGFVWIQSCFNYQWIDFVIRIVGKRKDFFFSGVSSYTNCFYGFLKFRVRKVKARLRGCLLQELNRNARLVRRLFMLLSFSQLMVLAITSLASNALTAKAGFRSDSHLCIHVNAAALVGGMSLRITHL